MTKRTYKHSAYWYAYHYGWTYSESNSCAGRYLDIHSYRPKEVSYRQKTERRPSFAAIHPQGCDYLHDNSIEHKDGEWNSKNWFRRQDAGKLLDSTFNPLLFGVCIAMDIGIAMRDSIEKLADPKERDKIKRELIRDLRIVRRPFYYFRETQRRRQLAAERRKIVRRRTTAPEPTPESIMSAWKNRKTSREAMIRLGGMLDDLSCYVDSCLKFDVDGTVVGRNGGIRGWLDEHIPELTPKYKTLMRYKAMATRLRQATGTSDPKPTCVLLEETPRHEAVAEILAEPEPVFSRVFAMLEHRLSPETVLLDTVKSRSRGRSRGDENAKERRSSESIQQTKRMSHRTDKPRTSKAKGALHRNSRRGPK